MIDIWQVVLVLFDTSSRKLLDQMERRRERAVTMESAILLKKHLQESPRSRNQSPARGLLTQKSIMSCPAAEVRDDKNVLWHDWSLWNVLTYFRLPWCQTQILFCPCLSRPHLSVKPLGRSTWSRSTMTKYRTRRKTGWNCWKKGTFCLGLLSSEQYNAMEIRNLLKPIRGSHFNK